MNDILATKLYVPGTPDDYILRPQLFERLSEGLGKKLTLVCAPPGFGKTSLVAGWLTTLARDNAPDTPSIRIAWYSIDDDDNEIDTFENHLIAAIQRAEPSVNIDWVRSDQRQTLFNPKALASAIIHACLNLESRLVIILDDYQYITNPVIHQMLDYLLRYLPNTLHIVLISRFDPPINLTTMRARAQVSEFRTSDLSLSREETALFYQQTLGQELHPDLIDNLWNRTEGWAVGLRLAAISLKIDEDKESFITRFNQYVDRYVAGYLLDEALSVQEPNLQEFLLVTSILDRYSNNLCAAVTGKTLLETRVLLDEVQDRNLFIVPLDDHEEWYRYHKQFQNMLMARLQEQYTAGMIQTFHQRAADWLAAHSFVGEAITHYLAIGDEIGAARIVEGNIARLLNLEKTRQLDRWISRLPASLIQTRPALLMAQAWIHYFNTAIEQLPALVAQAVPLLDLAEDNSLEPDAVRGQVLAMQTTSYINPTADATSRAANACEALELLPKHHGYARAFLLKILSQQALRQGDYPGSRQIILEEINTPDISETIVHLYSGLSTLDYSNGSMNTLQHTAEAYLAESIKYNNPAGQLLAKYLLGVVYLERKDPLAASYLEQVVSNHQQAPIQTLLLAANLLLTIYGGEREYDKGTALVNLLQQSISEHLHTRLYGEFQSLVGYWALKTGNQEAAKQWVCQTDDQPIIYLAAFRGFRQAETLIKLGCADDLKRARLLLEHMYQQYENISDTRGLINTMVLLAQVYWLDQSSAKSLEILGKALDLGFPLGYRRTFVEDGPLMMVLLNRLSRESHYSSMTAALTSFALPMNLVDLPPQVFKGDIQLASLTYRELDVFELVVQGMTNAAAADRLFISPNTVRNHLVNIYEKLQVNNRRALIERARQMGFTS